MNRILRVIGKGQITIPQEWRVLLDLESNMVQATLKGNQIIIKSAPFQKESRWNVQAIGINQLSKEDQKLLREGRRAYKKGQKEKFLTANEFFNENV